MHLLDGRLVHLPNKMTKEYGSRNGHWGGEGGRGVYGEPQWVSSLTDSLRRKPNLGVNGALS